MGIAAVLLLSLLALDRAFPDSYTWRGGGDNYWSDSLHWWNETQGHISTPTSGYPSLTSDNATISSGTAILDSNQNINNLTISGSGSLSSAAPGLRLEVYGNAGISGTGTFASNIVLAMFGASNTLASTITLGSLEINSTGTILLASAIVLAGQMNIAAGSLDVDATFNYPITVGTNWLHAGNFDERQGTVTFTGTGTCQEIASFYNLVISGTGNVTLVNNLNNVTNNLTLDGVLNLGTPGTYNLTVLNNLTGAGTLTATTTNAINVAGSFTPANFTRATSTVTLSGANNGDLGGLTFNNLIFAKSAQGNTMTSTGGLTVNGTLTMTTGTWNAGAGSYTHTITGAWNSSGPLGFTFNAGTSTITLSSANPTITTKGLGTDPFNNLALNNGGSLASAVQTTSNLSITGTLSLNDFNITVGGNLSGGALTALAGGAAEIILVAGNWSIPSGSFTWGNSTVRFNNSGLTTTISGNHTFNNLSCTTPGKTIQFTNGSTQTVNGTFTITGASGNLIRLVSTAAAPWTLANVGNTENVSYAYVQYSNVLNNDITAATSTNGGNNDDTTSPRWIFPGATAFIWTGGTASPYWNVAGNWDQGYIPNAGDSVTIPNAGIQPATLAANTTIANLNITTGGADLGAYDLSVTNTLQVSGSGRLRLQGTQTVSALTTSFAAGTVEYYGAVTTTGLAAGNTYNNLELTGGTRTLNANLNVNNTAGSNLTVSGATLDLVSYNLNVTGDASFDATSTFILQGGQTVNIGGTRTYSGTVRYNGTGTYGLLAAGYTYGGLLHFNGTGTWSLANTLNANGALTIDAGTLNAGGNAVSVTGNLTVSGSGLLAATAAGETITITNGNVDFTSNAVNNFTQGASTVVLQGAASMINAPDETFNSLTVNKGAGATTVTLNSIVRLSNVSGTLTMTQGTLALNTNTLRLGTDLNMSSASAATIAIGTGIFDGGTNNRSIAISNAAATITQGTGTLSCNNLSMSSGAYTLSGAGAINAAGNVTVIGGTFTPNTSLLTMSGPGTTIQFTAPNQPYDLTISAGGTGVTINAADLTVGHNLTVNAAATLGTSGRNLTVTAGGALSVSGTLNGSAGRQIMVNGGVTAGATGTINLNGGDLTTGNLTVSRVPGLIASASELITVNGSLNFSAADNNFTQATSSVVLQGAATNLTAPEESFYDLSFTAAGTVTLQSAITVGRDLSIGAGTTLAGNNNNISVARNWSKNATGGFTAGTGTVVFDGAGTSVISGNTTFNNLTCATAGKTIRFTAGTTQTVNGSFTITGAAGAANLIRLISTAAAVWFLANVGNTENVTFAYVQYSDALSNDIHAGTSANAGNNDDLLASPHWVFTPTTVTWTGAAANINWDDGGNWDNGYPPNDTDDATIDPAAWQPSLNTSTVVVDLTINGGATVTTNDLALTVGGSVTGAGTLQGLAGGPQELISVGGDFTVATYTANGTKLLLSGATQPVNVGPAVGSYSFYDLEIAKSNSTDVVNAVSVWTVTNSFTMSRGTWNAGAFSHSIAGAWNSLGPLGFTFNAGTSTITLTSANPAITTKAPPTDPFFNLTLNNGGTLLSSVQASQDLSIAGGSLALNNQNLTVGRHLTGAGLAATNLEAISVGGNWNIASFTPASSTVTFTGASGVGPFTVTSNGQSFNQVVLDAGTDTYRQADVASVLASLTLSNGTWDTNNANLTVAGSITGTGVLQGAAGLPQELITVGGNFTVATYTANNTKVLLSGATQPVNVGPAVGSYSFYDLEINKANPTDVVNAVSVWTVTNSFTMSRGTWNAGAFGHSIAGAWNSSSPNFTFNAGSSTITLTSANPGITTKVPPTDPFFNLTLNNGGTLLSSVQVSQDLSIAGVLNTNDQNLTVLRHLSGTGTLQGLVGVLQELITVGGNFTVATYTANNTKVLLSGATQPVNVGPAVGSYSFYDLEINKANPTDVVNAANVWIATNSLLLTRGTWNGATFTHDIRVPWDATSANFTFTPSTSTINMTTNAGLTINNSATNFFWNLMISTSVSLNSDIVVLNDLTITATGALDVRQPPATDHQITVGHNWTRTAPGTFIYRNGWVVFNDNAFTVNGALSTTDPAGETFWNLRIDESGGTFTYNNDLTILSEIHLASGTLAEGGTRLITMGTASSPAVVIWRNTAYTVGDAGFSNTAGKVTFGQPGSVTTYNILGRTTFFNFESLTPGAVLKFEDNTTGNYTLFPATDRATIVTGNFHVVGAAGNLIILDNTSGIAVTTTCPTLDIHHWVLHITGIATIDYVNVSNSWAPPGATVTPGPNSVNGGHNCNWLFVIPIIASWTVDSAPANGRIDRIRVQVDVGTQLSDNFDPAKLRAVVQGYTVIGFGTAPGPVPPSGEHDDVFDILLQERSYLDSDAKPRWQLLTNDQPNGLYGLIGGAYVESGSKVYTAADGARPVLGYTLAVAGQPRAYLHFSEPVYTDAVAPQSPIVAGDFFYSDGGNPINGLTTLETSGNGAHAAMITFTSALTTDNILLATAQTLNAIAAQVYDQPYTVNPGTYPRTNLDGNLNPVNKPMLATPHRVSDVGLGLMEPVFATDQVTQRDPLRGGIGRITVFDGSGFLQDVDTLLQARILAATATNYATTITWDTNVLDPILLARLWIPTGVTTLFPPAGRDSFHNADTNISSAPGTQLPLPADQALRDFLIPAADSKVVDGAELQFLFTLNDGAGNVLPLARIVNPTDPRTARPWSYKVRDLRTQRGSVTILHNVIDPTRGEKAGLAYSLSQSGFVTITVFDLKGDVVQVLFRGQRDKGSYATTWDGRNRGGRIVARGIYFIKFVGPGVNEIRKVLVVK